jgi:hypothetical protein
MDKRLELPAPIDGKNVTTDWIEDIFDNLSCVKKQDCAVGFINDQPVLAAWSGNYLVWKFLELETIKDSVPLAELRKRLEKYHDPERDLEEKFAIIGNLLLQQFFWKDE